MMPMPGMMGQMPSMQRPMMNPMMGQGMQRPQMPVQQGQQMNSATQPNQPLTAGQLAAAPPGVQKQMLGEKLFPLIAAHQPDMAGKITGMMLEMDNSELLILLESDQQLKLKVDEALRVLDQARP